MHPMQLLCIALAGAASRGRSVNLSAWAPVIPRPQRLAVLGAVERVLERLLLPVEDAPQGRLAEALTAFLAAHGSSLAPYDPASLLMEAAHRLR